MLTESRAKCYYTILILAAARKRWSLAVKVGRALLNHYHLDRSRVMPWGTTRERAFGELNQAIRAAKWECQRAGIEI